MTLRRLKAWALHHELDPNNIRATIAAADVPVSDAPCRGCADPCDEGHPEYPERFKVDMETQMLGTVRPYRRQILISTAAKDWDRDVTSTRGSLAAHVSAVPLKTSATVTSAPRSPGIFDTSASTEIAILNGSHASISDGEHEGTVLVFPDYVAVAGVPETSKGAQLLWKSALDPAIPRAVGGGEGGLQTWVLPYACVITMCSHKRRDARCAIAAPKLEQAFSDSLHRRGWAVDNQLEHFIDHPLEKFEGTSEERQKHVLDSLKSAQSSKRALILYNSHVGGHKFSGLTIIYTPGGASVWYGRVSPHDVESIVENTIVGGLVLPSLLRGGLGLAKPGCKSLHDW